MKNRKDCCRFGLMLLALLVLLSGRPARAAWDQNTLKNRIRVTAPASGEKKLEILKALNSDLFAAIIAYQGGPLPAMNSIALELDPPQARRFHVSYFQGGPMFAPYQTGPVWLDSLAKAPAQTQFALWQEPDGEWGCLIALAGGGLRTYLQGDGKMLIASADSLDSKFAPSRMPMFAIGWGKDPYKLIDDIYAYGFRVMKEADSKSVIGKRRVEKKFPEIWGYLGWCSWNTYYRRVTQQDLFNNAASFKKAGVPVRWILIDDGWSQVNKQTMNPWWQGRLYLTGLEADRKKFPGGMKQTVKTLKQDYGITWVGVWHTFDGYWNGIQIDSDAGRACQDCLLPITDKVAVPDPRSDAGGKFWDTWYKFLKDSGVDFVKVDNQGTFPMMTRELLPVTHSSGQAHKNWETAAAKYFDSNVMDCMEQNIDTIYEWETTNLGRAAVDYTPFIYTNPRANSLNNVMNSLWFNQVLWPDYDMWMSNDWHVEYNAVAHAISGGPIYTTDKAGKEKFEYYWPLILSDGLVLRPDQPALPVRKYLLKDPKTEMVPLAAFAPVGEGGMIVVWNIDKFFRPIRAELSPSDIEGIAGDRFAIYEYFSGKLQVKNRGENFPLSLKAWDVKLFSVVPVKDGFAPIGLIAKYISPAAIVKIERGPGKARVELMEAGTFAAYCEQKPKTIKRDGAVLSDQLLEYSNHLLKVKIVGLTDGRPPVKLEFIW